MKFNLLLLSLLLFSFSASASTTPATKKISYQISLKYLMDNIHPAGTAKGIVVASPSKSHPDYFYHWVRDAALVMNTVIDLASREKNNDIKNKLRESIFDYVKRVQNIQLISGFTSLGEPKYHVDGSLFTGPWGRPQHDGPALRAITLIKWANKLISEGQIDYVLKELYSPILPAKSPIKQDLEYTARYFDKQGFDYWEEVKGLHFATAMAQRKALLMGAKLAKRLGDLNAIQFYTEKAKLVENLIQKFWSKEKGHILATLKQTGGVSKSHLDISTVLGVLHGNTNDGFYSLLDSKVLKTITKIEASFKRLYPINQNNNLNLATAIGRYPEDTYNGYNTNGTGHAWFLATFSMAEFHLKLATRLESNFILNDINFYYMKS